MTSDLPPVSIAYAIPEHDRVDGRVRRVLAGASILLGAVGTGTTVFFLALIFRLVPSSMYGGGRASWQMAFQAVGVVFDLLILVGGALLLRADLPVARLLIRLGCGLKVGVAVASIGVALVMSPYPASFTVGDRVYLILGNSLGHLVVPVALFAMTFALPPRRSR